MLAPCVGRRILAAQANNLIEAETESQMKYVAVHSQCLLMGLGRVKTSWSAGFGGLEEAGVLGRLCRHRRHQRPDAYDAHHPGHVVGQYV